MKTKGMVIFLAGVLLVTTCCVHISRGIVKPDSEAKNEVVVTNELRALLAEKPRPKLVIRVSNPPGNVTEAEKFNTYINQIEKELMQSGFIVRDRALLENLLRSGNADYQTIGEKIDTDIILDILSLQFEEPNRFTSYMNVETRQKEHFRFPDNYVDCPAAKLECRLTIVNKGQLGGMFTFSISRCDIQDLQFLVSVPQGLMRWAENPGQQWFRSLLAPIDTEAMRTYFVKYLAQKLMAQLLAGINGRMQQFADLYLEERFDEGQAILTELLAKDPDNYQLYVSQALLDAHRGDFAKAERQLESADLKAASKQQRTVIAYGRARVYALKNEPSPALNFLRKALAGGLADMVAVRKIRREPDLGTIADSAQFDELLAEYEPPPAEN
jgi:tetratricopeptide (TPR) repeat protein